MSQDSRSSGSLAGQAPTDFTTKDGFALKVQSQNVGLCLLCASPEQCTTLEIWFAKRLCKHFSLSIPLFELLKDFRAKRWSLLGFIPKPKESAENQFHELHPYLLRNGADLLQNKPTSSTQPANGAGRWKGCQWLQWSHGRSQGLNPCFHQTQGSGGFCGCWICHRHLESCRGWGPKRSS